MGSLDDIDSLEDLLKSMKTALNLKEKNVQENVAKNGPEIKEQEAKIQESEEMLHEEEISLKSAQNAYFIWNRAEKVRNCEEKIAYIKKDIQKHKERIEELTVPEREYENLRKSLRENEEKLEKLKGEEKNLADEPWRLIMGKDSFYCEGVKNHFLHRFHTLDISKSLSKWNEGASSKFVNLLLIGSTGCGKSSFVNTCTTALQNSGDMAHASVDQRTSLPSATMRLNLAPLKFSNGVQLPVRLFDCRGIHREIGHREMEKIIRGHIKPNTMISSVTQMEAESSYNKKPGLNNEMHCIVYVVRADKLGTQSMQLDDSVKEIENVRKAITDMNIPQCVLVTNVDRIVPRKDLKNIFHYHIALRYCKRASDILQIPLKYVHPMSNYCDEGIPTDEKDALALDILWKITRLGMNYLENQNNRDDIIEGFFE